MSDNGKSFWTSLGGILTGLAALIGAIATIWAIERNPESKQVSVPDNPGGGTKKELTTDIEPSIVDITRYCKITASGSISENPAEMAIDEDNNTHWNSGGYAPQWIELTIPKTYFIDSISLLVHQVPDGATEHKLLVQTYDSYNYELKRTFNGGTRNNQVLSYVPRYPLSNVQHLRIETPQSVSWVAWHDIYVFGHPSK